MLKKHINEIIDHIEEKNFNNLVGTYGVKIIEDMVDILKRLYNSNRTKEQKYELVNLYLNNMKKVHIRTLIYSAMILNYSTFEEQYEDILKYIKDEEVYERIINKYYFRCMNEDYTYKLNR